MNLLEHVSQRHKLRPQFRDFRHVTLKTKQKEHKTNKQTNKTISSKKLDLHMQQSWAFGSTTSTKT